MDMFLTNLHFTFHLFEQVKLEIPLLRSYQLVEHPATNPNQISYYFQSEHTLVNAPNSSNLLTGTVPVLTDPTKTYHVRVLKLEWYPLLDLIFDYSMTNIMHLTFSGHFSTQILQKLVYMPPLQFEYFRHESSASSLMLPTRRYDLVTFLTSYTGRRQEILRTLRQHGINISHISGFNAAAQKQLFTEVKILLNLHQTDIHHTPEEFRLLPFLLRGAVIISEDVPLREYIPYHEYIVWTNRSQLLATIRTVTRAYEHYFDRFHGPYSRLPDILAEMRRKAYQDLKHRLLAVIQEKNSSFEH